MLQPADSILKLKRLSREPGRFRWALATAMSRSFTMPMNVGTIVQDANMLIPYAGEPFGMWNSSSCS